MFTVRPGMRYCPVGTSLSTGGTGTGQTYGWWQDVFGYGGACNTGYSYGMGSQVSSLTARLHPASTNPPRPVHVPTVTEIGGAKLADNIASWSTLVTAYAPFNAIVIDGNVNDVNAGTSNATFRTQVQTVLGFCDAYDQTIWMGALLGYINNGEKPSLFGDAFNLDLEAKNTIVAEEIALRGSRFTYADIRTPFKAWEVANNSGDVGFGLLTPDGVHLSTLGLAQCKKFMGSYITWATS